MKKLTALIIMDGYGIAADDKGNCIGHSGSQYIHYLMEHYPNALLDASGRAVGLPDGQMGNSEVGHLNIGAGRIVYQELTRITKEIEDGEFFSNKEFLKAIDNAKKNNGKLHLMGLLSDGGVHSHFSHLIALLELCKKQNFSDVFVHCYMDGRDVSPTSGITFIEKLTNEMQRIGVGKIATICGRYYAMDRDNRWDRVEKAYNMLTLGEGKHYVSPVEAVNDSYNNGITDEFIEPVVITENDKPITTIDNGDSVIFFNFRPDRAREITRAFMEDNIGFTPIKKVNNLTWVCFTQYDATFSHVEIAFKPQTLNNTLGEYLSKLNKKQLRIAETEKYAHVTFFFNGGVEKPNKNEDRALINSPKVATYDLKPEMSAYEVTDEAIKRINSGEYDVMILNFANCDMVGHTGSIPATIKAVATVDECVKKVTEAILKNDGSVFITADHGNADKMLDSDGKPFTAHTTNPVPFIYVNNEMFNNSDVLIGHGRLCDIAPTMLYEMGINKPVEMTGNNLIIKR